MRRDIFLAIADPTRRAIITLIALKAMVSKKSQSICQNKFLKLSYTQTKNFVLRLFHNM